MMRILCLCLCLLIVAPSLALIARPLRLRHSSTSTGASSCWKSTLRMASPAVSPKIDEVSTFAPKPTQGASSLDEYNRLHKQSLEDPEAFWTAQSDKHLSWFAPFTSVNGGGFAEGDVNWFANGKINACYNCVDKHAATHPDKVAIIYEGDEPGHTKKITYSELLRDVCRIANVMKSHGVRKGDVVTIYMPMVPELAMVMLACARIGAVHSIVFAGFSSESLRGRIEDCSSRFIFTADEGRRGGRVLKLKEVGARLKNSICTLHFAMHHTLDLRLILPTFPSTTYTHTHACEYADRRRRPQGLPRRQALLRLQAARARHC